MVNMIIDGKHVSAEENITIMEAAERNGIPIPKLCYLKGINEIAACRVCVVELEGKEKLITSCNNVVKDGMVIYTNSPKVRNHRRNTVQLLLSQHDNRCVVCPRNGNCQLQQVACDLNILDIPFRQEPEYQPWDKDFPLIRNSAKCIKCMRCVQVCDKIQGLGIWDVEGTGSRTTVNVAGHKTIREADCALCGQCITHCPVGALSERDDTEKVWDAIENKDKIVVAQVAPAVRAAWGEELGLADEDAPVGKIFDALKRMGVNYVFDTVFSADLTIMEESTEFIKRFTSGELKERPMFTSCCPGWVRFAKTQFPYMVNYLSTAKSPQQMFGAVMKTYFAEKLGVSTDQIFTLSIMPCVAKKGEREMDLFYGEYAGHDVDAVLTTRELVKMIRSAHIRPDTLVEIPGDSPMHAGTGAGVIFGATGGVMEISEMKKRPVLTMLSGPAASVMGSLMYLRASNGVYFEVGGTTTNIGVIKDGRPAIDYSIVGGHRTYISSLDVRVLGVAGGSMVRADKSGVKDVGPRSAHIAGMDYAVFTPEEEIVDPKVIFFSPKEGDPDDYVAIELASASPSPIPVPRMCWG